MVRPLHRESANILAEMTDSQLERLVYTLQRAYANQLDNGGNGHINVGGSGTAIGSASDTLSTVQTNSRAAPTTDGINQTYPSYPGIGSTDSGSFSYKQDRSVPSFPSNTVLDEKGFVKLDGSSILEVSNDETEIYNAVISQTVTAIKTGNEVGSYRVSSSTPNSGGAGTWTDKGTFFHDDRYDNVGETTFKLWLKTDLTTPPGTEIKPIGITSSSDGNLIERDINAITDIIIADVLLPILTRRISSGDLQYTVSGTNTNSRGSFTDTRFSSSINTQFTTGSGASEVYYSRSTPNTSGSTTTVNTYYLNMS